MHQLTYLSSGIFEENELSRTERMIKAAREYNELGIRNYPNSKINSKMYYQRALYISNQLLKEKKFISQALTEKARAIGKLGMLSNFSFWAGIRLRHARYLAYQASYLDKSNYMAQYVIATCYNWLPRYLGGSESKARRFYQSAISIDKQNIFMNLSYAKFLISTGDINNSLDPISNIINQSANNQVDLRRQLEAMVLKMRIENTYIPDRKLTIHD